MIYRIRHWIIEPLGLLWLTLTVASVVIGAVAWSRFSHSIDATAEAEEIRESIAQIFSMLRDAEASQRGFLLTGNPTYREAFTKAVHTLTEAFQRLAAAGRRAGRSSGVGEESSGVPRTQVSLLPPPICMETTSELAAVETRVRPPGRAV